MTSREPLPLLGTVLCGGKSTRMGQDKALLPHPSGGTYWNHAVQRLASLCEEVCLSGSHSFSTDLPSLDDEIPGSGPVAGIAVALRHASLHRYDAALVTPIDLPYLTTDDLETFISQWCCNQQSLVIGVSQSGRQIQPLIGIYPTSFADELAILAKSSNRSLRRWLDQQTYLEIEVPDASCRNINTPEDLQRGW